MSNEGDRVFVYRNLHRGCWSVRALSGPSKGRVIAHLPLVWLTDCQFRVQPAGQAKVRATGRKNVHAGVVGRLADQLDEDSNWVRATYDPYQYDTFVVCHTGAPIHRAAEVALTTHGVYTCL